ncbi:MAG: methylated-DNA--[protein]-cysteine S-methyltransferase [Caulobacteraceae bacterium]|nr:methylated-DNA--[protein]-cysteine S-methyltransferase [Caulobacteraceae bacterium]
MTQAHLTLDRMPTPLGEMRLVTDEAGALRGLDWTDHAERMDRLLGRYQKNAKIAEGRAPNRVRQALEAYFAGELSAIDALPVDSGGTEFQRAAWKALRQIPAGETRSYGAQAKAIGKPAAVRAVGLANGANPVGIVVPCHRVIGANATLTGYGGGVERKRWLLEHEGVELAPAALRIFQ